MRATIVYKSDFDRLLTEIQRDPQFGPDGGSKSTLSDVEKAAHDRAFRFFNYVIHRWIASVQSEG